MIESCLVTRLALFPASVPSLRLLSAILECASYYATTILVDVLSLLHWSMVLFRVFPVQMMSLQISLGVASSLVVAVF